MVTKPMPSQDRLKELFDYHPDGHFIRRIAVGVGRSEGTRVGDPITGRKQLRGTKEVGAWYLDIGIDGVRYPLHRIVRQWHFGDVPPGMHVDHIDRDTLNNRIENLRVASAGQNALNAPVRKNNRSGFRGVSLHKPSGKFQAFLSADGKRRWLGHFNTPEEAARAYDKAAKELHGEFASLNFP